MPSESENTNTDEKFAIRKLMRLQDGTVGVFFVDALTGQVLESLDGYTVISAGNLEDKTTTEETGEQSEDTGDYTPTEDNTYDWDQKSWDDTGGSYASLGKYSENDFPDAPSPVTSSGGGLKGAVKSSAPDVDYGPRLDAYKSGYGTNDEYARQQAEREAARAPVSSLEAYKSGYGNPYSSPSTEAPEDSLEGRPGLSMTPGSSGERRQESYYGTKDANFGLDAPTKTLANAIAARTEAEHVNSGFRQGPESGTNYAGGVDHNHQVGGATHSQHQVGNSFDLNLEGLTTKEKQDVISDLGFLSSVTPNTNVNLGFYTGSEVVHVDANAVYGKTKDNPTSVSLMNDRTRTNAYAGIPDWAKEALTPAAIDARAPVPADKPAGMQKNEEVARTNNGRTRSNDVNENTLNKNKEDKTVAQSVVEGVGIPDNRDLFADDLTPAEVASYGLGRTPSEAEITDMARTFAGELAPSTLTGIVNNDPTALGELASMVSSYENRMNSKNNESVTRGSQYNSNMAKNAGVTDYNNGLFGQALAGQISGFYGGALAGLGNTNATHYYNPEEATPSWASLVTNPTTFDSPHVFGPLSRDDIYSNPNPDFLGYVASPSYYDKVMGVATDRVNRQAGLGGMDNSGLIGASPFGGSRATGSPIGGYYGDSGYNYGAGYDTPSGNYSGGFSVGDVVGSLGGDPSYGGASYGSEYGGSYGGSAPGGGYSVGDISDSLGGSGGDNQGGYGGSSGGNNDGYGGGGSLGGGAEGWGQGGGGSSSSGSGNSFGGESTAATGGGTDGYFSGW